MSPDPAFVKKLRGYDPALRVVWSARRECWLIERRVRRARLWYGGESRDPDVKRRYLDGYTHVGNVSPRMLDDRVLVNLWKSDMWRLGGAKAVNQTLDDYWATKEQREGRTQQDDLRAVAGDMYDYIAWRRKGRVAIPAQVGTNGSE